MTTPFHPELEPEQMASREVFRKRGRDDLRHKLDAKKKKLDNTERVSPFKRLESYTPLNTKITTILADAKDKLGRPPPIRKPGNKSEG